MTLATYTFLKKEEPESIASKDLTKAVLNLLKTNDYLSFYNINCLHSFFKTLLEIFSSEIDDPEIQTEFDLVVSKIGNQGRVVEAKKFLNSTFQTIKLLFYKNDENNERKNTFDELEVKALIKAANIPFERSYFCEIKTKEESAKRLIINYLNSNPAATADQKISETARIIKALNQNPLLILL